MMRTVFAAAAAVWMGLIFFASSLPSSSTGPDTALWTLFLKTLHFMIYGVLSLLYLGVLTAGRQAGPGAFLASLLLTVLYAVSDEYHQAFSPGRHPSARDVLIDTAGALVFLGTAFLLTRRKGREQEPACGGNGGRCGAGKERRSAGWRNC